MEKSTKFLNFMELLPDATVILDVASDKVVYVNASCQNYWISRWAVQWINVTNSSFWIFPPTKCERKHGPKCAVRAS